MTSERQISLPGCGTPERRIYHPPIPPCPGSLVNTTYRVYTKTNDGMSLSGFASTGSNPLPQKFPRPPFPVCQPATATRDVRVFPFVRMGKRNRRVDRHLRPHRICCPGQRVTAVADHADQATPGRPARCLSLSGDTAPPLSSSRGMAIGFAPRRNQADARSSCPGARLRRLRPHARRIRAGLSSQGTCGKRQTLSRILSVLPECRNASFSAHSGRT